MIETEYEVTIREILETKVKIRATSKEDSLQEAMRMYHTCEIILMPESIVDTEFESYAPGEKLVSRLNQMLPEDVRSEYAICVGNRVVHIQSCDMGYDYNILDSVSHEILDGGVYDDTEVSIKECLGEILGQLASRCGYADIVYGSVSDDSEIIFLSEDSIELCGTLD